MGDDPHREGLKDTPDRVSRSWKEMFCGYDKRPESVLTSFAAGNYDEIVLVKNIEFYSTCEHHLLPFVGTAAIAYIPDGKIVGLSKLPRLLDIYAKRLQVQERITTQVTEALNEHLKPKASACVLSARHLCMGCRGVRQADAITVTSSMTGAFRDNHPARMELMRLIG